MWFDLSLLLAFFDQIHFCKTDVLSPIESLIPISTFIYKKTCIALLNFACGLASCWCWFLELVWFPLE